LVRQFCREGGGAILHPGSIQGKRPLDAACHGGNGGAGGATVSMQFSGWLWQRPGLRHRSLGRHFIDAIGQGADV
jgi:hypothetical protein